MKDVTLASAGNESFGSDSGGFFEQNNFRSERSCSPCGKDSGCTGTNNNYVRLHSCLNYGR
jgi:hypothetical protein